jgi:cytochrome subunit of sulfide dehydrogenase
MLSARSVICSVLLSLGISGAAFAQEPGAKLLVESCVSCHGPGGVSPGPMPSLDGLEPDAVAEALRAFRGGDREATIMDRIARGLSDAQIDMLQRHLETGRQE